MMIESLVVFLFGVVVGICSKIVYDCYDINDSEGDDMAKQQGKGDQRIIIKHPLQDRLCELECMVQDQQLQHEEQRHDIHHLITQGAHMAEEIERLKASNERMKAAAAAREQRDVEEEARDAAQRAVDQENIALLRERIAILEAQIAGGGLSPEAVAAIEATIADIDAVTTSLEAADPTPPVVEP